MKQKIAIFASGSGTNAQSISSFFKKSLNIEIALIISNKSDAYVLERAKRLKIPYRLFPKKDWQSGVSVLECLNAFAIDYIVLAGFLLKIPSVLIDAYPNKILNIHPALLPKYGGKGMYGDRVHQAVIDAKELQSGITIHYVNEAYDEGNIIFQTTCAIAPNESVESLSTKIHQLEYTYYPLIIEKVINQTKYPSDVLEQQGRAPQ